MFCKLFMLWKYEFSEIRLELPSTTSDKISVTYQDKETANNYLEH